MDDYVGSIPVKNASFWYNADSIDGDLQGKCPQGVLAYGDHPPVQSLVFLNRDLYVCMNGDPNSPPPYYPNSPIDYFYFFDGFYGKNNPLKNIVTGLPAKHTYSDNPNDKNGWSMYALKWTIGDQRLFNVAAIGDLDYNQNAVLELTYIYHNDPDSNHIQNVNVAYDQIDQMHSLYASGFKNSCSNSHCTNDCVWTGDTNNDRIVNYLDAVNIFKGYLEIETNRKNVWIWKGQESLSWSKNFANGLNYKYADANGDAIINEIDLEPLKIYHDFKHGNPVPNPISCDEGDDFTWKITKNDSILKAFITFQITLDAPVKNFQGISFEIPLDPELINNFSLTPKSIWQDTVVKSFSYIENAKDPFDKSAIKAVYFNKTKKDEQASTEVNWAFTIQRKIMGNFPYAYYDLKVCNGKLYLNDGTIIPLNSQKIRIYVNPVATDDEISKDSLFIYPQPSSNHIVISKPELVNSWKLYTMQGQLLKTKQTNKSESLFDIDFLYSGSYFIELILDQRKIMQRIIVMRP